MEEIITKKAPREKGYQKIELRDMTIKSYSKNEAYKTLRTNVMFCGSDKKVIAFTSCHPEEGKSTTVMQLARALTEVGKRVLVVDADMRRSMLAARYCISGAQYGLSQFLSGQVEKRDIICETQMPGFFVVFAGYYPPNPVELLDSEAFRSFIAEAREEFDYVLVDCPPLLKIVDAIVVAKCCDGVLLVIGKWVDSVRTVRPCKTQIEKSGCPVLGVILNSLNHRKISNKKDYYQKYTANEK